MVWRVIAIALGAWHWYSAQSLSTEVMVKETYILANFIWLYLLFFTDKE